jgi:protein SCO1/2
MKGSHGIAVLAAFAGAAWVFTACNKEAAPPAAESTSTPAPPTQQTNYSAVGVIKELEPDGKTVVVRHEAISNYMAAMTMPFEVHDTNLLRGLHPGDTIDFQLVVTPKEGWIEKIHLRDVAPDTNTAATPASVQTTPAVEPLDVGDPLPDYHFTNELGQAVSLTDYKGSVLAFTFFFTSCPFPNFCPRMTSNFAEAAAELKTATNAPAKWHLLSISFDPKTDTPDRLLNYANNAHYDPAHWSFLTGDTNEITELADQFGENFWTDGASISHNLRTVVINPRGQVRMIFKGNSWLPAQLVSEMAKAAKD